ncbi:MAG: tetratricopeptide repeat protein [Acidobacteria bacterium]|nr:tetratricopeptide repeat protein [Acidobacteriota bacterium]
MSLSRLEALAERIERNPKDLLARYGLAMEYAQQGAGDKALEHFRILIESHPDYVAAYYQAGRLLQRMGQVQEARELWQRGIQASARVGDLHSKSELEAALAEL